MDQDAIFEGYATDAGELVPRFEALDTEIVLGPVLDLVPNLPGRTLDIGAGTGRDAAWLESRGHHVLAVEPVGELRHAGQALHADIVNDWLEDSLPLLERTKARGDKFDLILCIAVWQHLPAEQHGAAIATISSLLARAGRVILSIRHGPGATNRTCFAADTNILLAAAKSVGLKVVARRRAESVQNGNREAGVMWDWLCFDQSR